MTPESMQRHIDSLLGMMEQNMKEARQYATSHPATLCVIAANIARNAAELASLAGRQRGMEE